MQLKFKRLVRTADAQSPGEFNPSTQHFVEFSCWGHVAEGLAGPGVELQRDRVERVLAVAREVGAFGQILAKQPVGVLVAAALPGAAGIAEVDDYVGRDGELLVAGELGAAIPKSASGKARWGA